MAYSKTTWKNRLVERPRTFRFQQNADGTVTLNPEEGQIFEPGTPVNATNLNNIENGIAEHLADVTNKTDETKGAAIIGMKPIDGLTGDNVRTAIQNLFQFANDGKTAVANATSAKGVPASPSDTFSTLATKIGQISTGKKVANGSFYHTFTANKQENFVINGLDFLPRLITVQGGGIVVYRSIDRNSNYYTGSAGNGMGNISNVKQGEYTLSVTLTTASSTYINWYAVE